MSDDRPMNQALAFLTVTPPAWVTPQHLHPPMEEIQQLEELGLGVTVLEAKDNREIEACLEQLATMKSLRIVALLGHGWTYHREGRPPKSCILHEGTDEGCRIETGYDVERLVEKLRPEHGTGRLIVLDACEVELRDTLDGGSPLSVLLAQQSGKAEAHEGVGILSQCFARQLHSSTATGQRVADLIEHTITMVKDESYDRQLPQGSRQVPIEKGRGSQSFRGQLLSSWLDLPERADKATGSRQATQALLDVCDEAITRQDPLPASLDSALYHRLRKTHPMDDDTLELALAIGAWLSLVPGAGGQHRSCAPGLRELLGRANQRHLQSKAIANATQAVAFHLGLDNDKALALIGDALDMARKLNADSLMGRLLDQQATMYGHSADRSRDSRRINITTI